MWSTYAIVEPPGASPNPSFLFTLTVILVMVALSGISNPKFVAVR
jgi:hypothetical protein